MLLMTIHDAESINPSGLKLNAVLTILAPVIS